MTEWNKTTKLFALLIFILAFLVANHFNDFFVWDEILQNKAILTFTVFCILIYEILRTVFTSD